ncbi:MAG TPA: phosphatase PAP2 family protein [Patescibacteria group bacterium]|nr:phosphatase PAP2 family protein [Patescibacteria group bacterium]
MGIADQTYLRWQKRLQDNKVFRRFWTLAGVYITGFFYLGIVLCFVPGLRPMVFLGFASFVFARFVICEGIYFFYKKVRPYQNLGFLPPIAPLFLSFDEKRSNSFPSGHAASLAAISAVCFVFSPLLGILGFAAAILNGAARVILGYHYLSDVLAGWAVGIFSAWAMVFWLMPLLFTR